MEHATDRKESGFEGGIRGLMDAFTIKDDRGGIYGIRCQRNDKQDFRNTFHCDGNCDRLVYTEYSSLVERV